jgi:hypothetical protein
MAEKFIRERKSNPPPLRNPRRSGHPENQDCLKGWATRPLFALKRLLMPSGPVPTGGPAVLRIRLAPLQGRSRNAVLRVNCAQGDVSRDRSVEGIRLSIEGDANDFSEEGSGRVMFLSIRPEVSASAKAPRQEKTQNADQPAKN